MQTVEIIHLSPDQWQVYKQIRLEALRSDPQAFGSSYAESVQRPDAFWQGRLAEAEAGKKGWLLFARLGDQIVGSIGAYIHEDAPTDETDTAEIIGMYVTPAARGKGIASALVKAIVEEVAKDTSIRRLTLGVNGSQAAALALYRFSGFTVTGSVTVRLGDGQDHEVHMMEKRL